jgi:hypothetical protein
MFKAEKIVKTLLQKNRRQKWNCKIYHLSKTESQKTMLTDTVEGA